jgi:hypothetical protein
MDAPPGVSHALSVKVRPTFVGVALSSFGLVVAVRA